MAIRAQDTGITREQVYDWVQEYEGQIKPTKKMRDFLAEKIIEADLDPNVMVDTFEHQNLSNETALVDMILMDIESYAGSN